jgi:hypothetical protein
MGGLTVVLAAQGNYQSSDPPGWFFGGLFVIWGVMMVFALAGYVFGIWSLVEILRYREDEFVAVGKNRTTWLVLQIAGLVACQPLGAVVGILFLWKHRPALREWREAHPLAPAPMYWYPPSGYGPPPGYGQPPPPGHGPPPPPPYGQPAGYGPPPGHDQAPPPEPAGPSGPNGPTEGPR